MKQISFSAKQIVVMMLLFLGSQCIYAQTSPSTNSTMSIQTDAVFGPTLYICSNKETNDYTKSKALAFGVPVPYSGTTPNPSLGTTQHTRNSGFVLVKVGVDNDNPIDTSSGAEIIKTAGSWVYLNEAINFFLTQNYQRIIILEGEYEVNGPIIVDKLNGSTNELAQGRITIEGEGFGTRIKNASTYTSGNIFEVRSYFNTIKNLSIISNNANTCLAITTANSTVDPRNNVFENLYIGVQTMVSNDTPVTGRKGITLNSTNKQIGFNRFKNISFNSVDVGVELQGALRLHDNHFENFVFENTIVGVEFLSNTDAWDNIFDNLAIQKDNYSKNLVKGITGRHNTFTSLNHSDWNNGGQTGHSLVTISANAEHTTIQNSEVGRGTVYYLTDAGKYTQLINNYGGNSDVTYKLGNDKNTDNASAISLVEILGRLKIAGNDANNDATNADGKVLTSDANGYATWKDGFWNHIATKNIKMDGFALTNHSNATPATNTDAGLRLDNNGNVRIGTTAPDATNPAKLQVDGRVFVGTPSTATNDYDANYKLLVNGKVLVRNEVYVKQDGIGWADYVFAKDYKLMPLQEVEQHIQEKGHLPNMPSASEVEKDGIAVGDIIKRQQEKIEELTLYLIEMKKQNDELQNRMEVLEQNQKKN